MSNVLTGLYTFGSYRLDVPSRVLTCSGSVVTLAPKTFDLLVLMAESGGRLLRKRELMEVLWSDAFVEESNLSFQVTTLRKALGEEGRGWIEAVPKYGYKFTASVQRSAAMDNSHHEVVQASSIEPAVPGTRSRRSRSWLASAGIAALVAAAGFGSWQLWFSKKATHAALHVIPATSYPGPEATPSFSPDGTQIAFSWNGGTGENSDIYVKLVGENRALRLTSNPHPEFSPAWSPDGRYIAFCRDEQDGSEIVLIPALGGPERVIAKLPKREDTGHTGHPLTWFNQGGNQGGGRNDRLLAWFPDGESLAFVGWEAPAGPDAIFRLSLDTGEMQALTFPPSQSGGDFNPAVSANGHHLAFTRSFSTPDGDLYVAALTGTKVSAGEPQRLTRQEDVIHGGLAWASDNRRLLFASRGALWTVGLDGAAPEPVPLPGYNPGLPTISAKGDRLAFVESSEDLDIWRVDGPARVHGRAGAAQGPPTRLISSTLLDTNPQYSPDGSQVAFTSSRSGTQEIWVCDSDGSNPAQLTNLKDAGTPRWSPDSRHIAFDSPSAGSFDIYVISAQGGPAHRITFESSTEDIPSWSQDGKWIYFESDRSGTSQVWKTPFAGGAAVQVTHNGGADAFESYDGKFVFYSKRDQTGIWRQPIEGGVETFISDRGSPFHWGLFDKGVCVVDRYVVPDPTIACLDFGTNRWNTVSTLPENMHVNDHGPSFSVSRDGRWILYAGTDRQESDIMVVENFRLPS
jgi:Tol biopolymer transport system component/DNA-binding winged helix-turn-helix (wHTH) protein